MKAEIDCSSTFSNERSASYMSEPESAFKSARMELR